MMEKIIATLFLSRELAHRAHLSTPSYSEHMALQIFYEGIIEHADALAEAYQGRYGPLDKIPLLDNETEGDIADVLEGQLAYIEMHHDEAAGSDRPLQNLIDTACGLYLSTLYKLRQLA
jgi:Family of unknown function (DUF5856)